MKDESSVTFHPSSESKSLRDFLHPCQELSMRVLIGHIDNIPQLQQHAPLPTREDRNDDIRAYGRIHPQIRYEPGMSWPQLLANCPPGWRPEIYIHRSPEYNAVPLGMEQADCLTVGVFGDWNLGGQMIHSV